MSGSFIDPSHLAAVLGGDVSGNNVSAPGPNNVDRRRDRSMSVTVDPHAPDGFIVKSHSLKNTDLECKDYVRAKLGLPAWKPAERGLSPVQRMTARKSKVTATYVYRDADGQDYLRVERTDQKSFLQSSWTGTAWKYGKPKGPKIPYRLPDILAAVHDTVLICEGEKDADALHAQGFVATTASEGAGKWSSDLNQWFEGKTVHILPDNDQAGELHAAKVAASLHGIADEIRIVRLPGLPKGGDVSDYLDENGGADLIAFCEAVPLFDPDLTPPHDPETGEILDETPARDDLPDPVDLWGKFDAPELPEGLLPPLIEHWARVNADKMGCDPAGLAMAALASSAAAISDEVQLKVKRHDDWKESARIWVALVGDPSTKKSPVLSAASSPVCRLDARMMEAWLKQAAEYDALEPAEKKGKARPQQTRLRIEDATPEAAQQVLTGSPWGVLLLQDELSGFFGSLDKYSGGKGAQADRAFWLRAFNGGEYAINRVGRGAALIPNLSVCMLGGIQPGPLRKIASDSLDDGLLQRLFPIMLRRATLGSDEPSPGVNQDYAAMIEGLRRFSGPGPFNVGLLEFSDDAQVIRRELEAKHLELQGLESINRKLSSHIGKYDGLFARLCVIWHCIENVGAPEGLPPVVEADTAKRVGAFLHRFLLAHAISFYAGCLGLSDDHDRLASTAGYILTHGLERVTNRHIQRGDRTMRGLKDYEVRWVLEQLEALGWVGRVEGSRSSSSVPHFEVNPKVHAKFADRGRIEAERRSQAREAIAEAMKG